MYDVRPILRPAGRGPRSRTRDSRLSGPPTGREKESKRSKCDVWKTSKLMAHVNVKFRV